METVWFALPVVALLSQLGGTYKKQFRRFGIPTVMIITALIANGWSWWLLLAWATIFGVTTLPFTLFGDGLWEHPLNALWLPPYSLLLGLSGFPIVLSCNGNWAVFLYAQILTLVTCLTCMYLSNWKKTAYYFPWKFCEAVIWAAAMYPSLIIL